MEWNDTAIVLHVGRFREADIWLKLLTRSRGLVRVFAFGGSRSRRRFCGCLDVLNTISCRVKTTRNGQYFSLEEGTLLRGPRVVRHDLARLGMAMNCVRFIETLRFTQDGTAVIYALVQDMLTFFEEAHAPHGLYPVLFRLRVASEQGFSPALQVCAHCGKSIVEEHVTFYVNEGNILCGQCSHKVVNTAYAVSVPPLALELLRKVQQNPPLLWDVASLPAKDKQACFRVIDSFVQYHLGVTWEDGYFSRH